MSGDMGLGADLVLGIEIGGTKLQLGVGTGDENILHMERRSVDPARGAEGVRALILDAFQAIPESMRSAIHAIGIGFGGPVDADRGIVTVSHQVEGWADFPLVDWAKTELGVPVVVLQNDSDTAAFGEARLGAGKGSSPVLYVNSGSGIGGGLIIDGRIYRGAGRGAVEVGHLWIDDPDTQPNRPPRKLENIASGWGIEDLARHGLRAVTEKGVVEPGRLYQLTGGDPARVTAQLVATAALQGDPLAQAVLARATRAMARGLAHAITLLAPRQVILGGGVSLMDARLWLDPIRAAVDRLVFEPFRGGFEIVPAALGEAVVVQGALALARDALLEQRAVLA